MTGQADTGVSTIALIDARFPTKNPGRERRQGRQHASRLWAAFGERMRRVQKKRGCEDSDVKDRVATRISSVLGGRLGDGG